MSYTYTRMILYLTSAIYLLYQKISSSSLVDWLYKKCINCYSNGLPSKVYTFDLDSRICLNAFPTLHTCDIHILE